MHSALDTRQLIVRGLARVRAGLWPVTLAATAAAIAWWLAHRVLGHSQPFFAPIAAAISLSTSRIQRSRRITQMIVGVLLGIAIGVVLSQWIGISTVALGAIVFVTLITALFSAEGFFGEGMMFANQAAASAILVVTLHRSGTGSERAVDVLVGGAVALVLGVILFPADPSSLLQDAERQVLRALAGVLEEAKVYVRSGESPPTAWVLDKGYEVHQVLGALARARATAHTNVRVAPRRWRLRATVDAEIDRTARFDLLANAVLSLIRAATSTGRRPDRLPDALDQGITILASAIGRLASAPAPWPDGVVEAVRSEARLVRVDAAAYLMEQSAVVAAIAAAVASDLELVLGGTTTGSGSRPDVSAPQV